MPVEHTLQAACDSLNAAIATCPPATELHAVLLSMLAAHTAAARSPPEPIFHWQPTIKKVSDFAGDVEALLRARSPQDPEIITRVEDFKNDADALHTECDIRGLYTSSMPPLAAQRLCDRLLLCLESIPSDIPCNEALLSLHADNLHVILRSLPVFYSFIETLLSGDIGMSQFSERLTGFILSNVRQSLSQPCPLASAPCPSVDVSRFVRIRDSLEVYIEQVNNSSLSPETSGIITTILQLLWPGVGDEPLATEMEIMSSCVTFDTKSSELNFPTMLGATENSVLFKATFEIPGVYSEDTRPTWPTAVAVKMLQPSSIAVAREPYFRQEALRVTTFSHPCLLNIHGVHWPREVSAEKTSGPSLTNDIVVVSELMTNNLRTGRCMSPLSTPRARLRVLADVARALAYLHKVGVCHRGITPENVLLRIQDGLWFGHAKVDVTSFFRYSLFPEWIDSVPMRSWLFVAPEIFSGQETLYTSDTWSFGVLACFLMGEATEAEEKTYWKRVSGKSQKRLAWAWSGTIKDGRVREVVIPCLREKPEERPTAAQLVLKLEGIIESMSTYGESNDEIIGGNYVETRVDDELLDSNVRIGLPEGKEYCEFEDVCKELSARENRSDDESVVDLERGNGVKRKTAGPSSQSAKRRRVEKPGSRDSDPDWSSASDHRTSDLDEKLADHTNSPVPRKDRKTLSRSRAKVVGKVNISNNLNSGDEIEPSPDVEAVASTVAWRDQSANGVELTPSRVKASDGGRDRKRDETRRTEEEVDTMQTNSAANSVAPRQGSQHRELNSRSNRSNLGQLRSGDDLSDDDGAIFIGPARAQNGLLRSPADAVGARAVGLSLNSHLASDSMSELEMMNSKAESLQESGSPGCIEEAAALFRRAADAGNANAQVNYGNCLEHGRGLERDFCNAAMYFQMAAKQGNAKGQLRIGLCHEFGRGTKKDFKVAVQWYKKASEQGNTQAQTNLGIAYHQGHGIEKDYSQAAALYERAVKDGHTAAMLNLGVLSEHGLGVPKDTNAAFKLYSMAASGGNERAMLNLALCYDRGQGTPRDEQKATVMFIKSADAGNHQAQFLAAQRFEEGVGVRQNMVKAATYFQMAAERDNLSAMFRLGKLYAEGRGVDRDQLKAFKLFNAASKHGHSASTFCLAECFEAGVGVKRSLPNAITCLKKASEQKNPKAMVILGYKFELGVGVKKSSKDAVRLYKESARLGCAEGELALGQCFYYGYGMDKNMSDALRLYHSASQKNNAGACLELAHLYRDGAEVPQDYSKAFQLYTRAAAGRKALAHINLGEFYFYGRGVAQDYKKAVQHFKAAVAVRDEHVAEAYRWLGDCYSDGSGVEKNQKSAVRYFQKGAEAGSASAQLCLGSCYENGHGVEVNGAKAIHLYKKAEKAGNPTAMNNLGILFEKGKFVKRDYQRAFKQYTKAMEHGVIEAICNLADCYAEGHGTSKNVSKAFELYKEAAGHGHSGAQYELGACYYFGKGVEQDFNKAVAFFKQAGETEPEAIRQLGTAYFDGYGVQQDYAQALRLFDQAVKGGNEDAYLNMGLCYEHGNGVEQDCAKAAEFYRRASEGGNMTAMHCLGNLYFNGSGVKKDFEEALKWYQEGSSLELTQVMQ